MAMWQRFDAGEIREDFARISALGLDTIRFFLRWFDFQPEPGAMAPEMMSKLEILVDAAARAGLRTMPTLFCGNMSTVNWLPSWSLDRSRPRRRFRTITESSESPYGCADFYTAPLLDAQLYFARSVGERLRGHPAVFAWDLGNEFSNVREPASAVEAADWSRRLCDVLQETSGIPATAGTHAEDLTEDRRLRLSSLCVPFAFATMHGYPVFSAFSRNRLDDEVVPFLAAITASFARKPVIFTELGGPTCPPGKISPYDRVALPGEPRQRVIPPDDPVYAPFGCVTEDEMAAHCLSVLDRLHADGSLGAYWWAWADYADELAHDPPFDSEPFERSFGIIRSDGTDKPVAAALSAFARERRTVNEPVAIQFPPEDEYYRSLPSSTARAYDAFLRSIEERRAAAR